MKITRIEVIPKEFNLRYPSAVAYAVEETAANLIVRVDTSDGLTGWGNCAPDPVVTGERIEDVRAFLEGPAREMLIGQEADRISALDVRLQEGPGKAFPAARAGINIALLDLWGKRMGKPVYRLLGACRDRIATSMTVGLGEPAFMVERAKEYQAQGFQALKIKIGTRWEEDLDRVVKIREAVGGEIELRLDANQAYSAGDALKLIEALEGHNIEFLEQPTPAKNLDALREVSTRSSIPIMADESAVDLEDASRVARGRCARLINIKLMKAGGVTAATAINRVAEVEGLPAMIGCMDESVISIAAGLHFALSHGNVRYADLDGHFDLIDDVASGGVKLEGGVLIPSNEAGFGFQVRL